MAVTGTTESVSPLQTTKQKINFLFLSFFGREIVTSLVRKQILFYESCRSGFSLNYDL